MAHKATKATKRNNGTGAAAVFPPAKTATRMAKARKAPGNSAALQQKAADNVARLHNSKGKAETIAIVKGTADGAYIYVEGSKGSSFTRSKRGDDKAFRAVTTKGALYDPAAKYNHDNPAPKPEAKLARGVEGRMTENARKAYADQPKGNGKTAKAAAPKAAKNKQPSAGSNRAYKLGATKNTAKADSWRGYMLTTIMGSKDTDSAKAAHAKGKQFADKKLDFNWAAAQGYIVWSK